MATFAKSDSSDSDSVEIDAPSATIAMEKDHFSERSRKSNKSRSSKSSRKTTPDMPVEFNSSPTELNMAPPRKKAKALSASTPVMQKVRPNVSETVTKEQQVLMQQLREVRKEQIFIFLIIFQEIRDYKQVHAARSREHQ